jgi:outer membrane protein assembly factor BamB
MLRSACLAATLILVLTTAAQAADWPEFRGPTGQGIVTADQVPLAWNPEKNIAWKVAVPGSGWSSPVVVAERIYLTTAIPPEKEGQGVLSLRALCFDSRTGRLLWQQEVFRPAADRVPRIHNKNSQASPTPLVAGERLFVHFGHLGTACLNLQGEILWRNTDLTYEPVHGNGGTPVLVEGLLVFSCDGGDQAFVVALDCLTGQLKWRTERGNKPVKKFSFSTPLVITVGQQKQVVSPGSEAVVAYEASSGKEIWRVRTRGYSVIPRPVAGHGLVYICTGYDSPTLLAIRPDGHGDVTETHVAWSTRRGVPHTASLLLSGEELFMVSDAGLASCLDARTGKVHWQERIGGPFSASPILVDGKVYFLNEEGMTTVVRAALKYEVLARNDLKERTLASFAVVPGKLIVRTEKSLFCIVEKER